MNICEREPSISRSYEGSDIVYENLLGDISLNYSGSTPFNINKKIDISSDIEDIFDNDIFDINKEEIEKQNNYLLTDAEEEEQEEESIEGADPTTLPIKPQQIDVFDSILMDLDEKTKEMEKKQEKIEKEHKKKLKKKKRRKKMHKKNKKKQKIDKNALNIIKQTENDKKMLTLENCDEFELNPWILHKWEFKGDNERRSLRTLLCTLNSDILWNEILNDDINGWEIIKRKDIIYDDHCFKIYNRALNIFHYNKSLQRGDSTQQQIISAWIYNALQNAYNTVNTHT